MSATTQRIHYLDNLRALAMLLGVVFHAAIAYGPGLVNVWPASGGETSQLLDIIAWFTHLWRMPLFFLISGFFAMLLLRRRGLRGFLKNRAMRIAVPFIVFMPLVLIGIVAGMAWALQSVENPGPMLQTIIAMRESEQVDAPPFSTAHLWFLYNLFQFCLALALLYRLGLFDKPRFAGLLRPAVLLALVPLLLVPSLVSLPAPHPAPEQLTPQPWSFGFYGVFFLLGALLHDRLEVLDTLKPLALPLLAGSLAMYAVVYPSYPQGMTLAEAMAMAMHGGPGLTAGHLVMSTLSAYIAVFMTLVCLVLGRRFLSGNNRVMRYVADSSYWVYIVHMPVVFVVQYALMDVQWGAWAEFFVSLAGTLGFGLATYALLVRWTPIGMLLNGRRVPLRARPEGKRWDTSAV